MCKICDKYRKIAGTIEINRSNYMDFVWKYGIKHYVFVGLYSIADISNTNRVIMGETITIKNNEIIFYTGAFWPEMKLVPLCKIEDYRVLY